MAKTRSVTIEIRLVHSIGEEKTLVRCKTSKRKSSITVSDDNTLREFIDRFVMETHKEVVHATS